MLVLALRKGFGRLLYLVTQVSNRCPSVLFLYYSDIFQYVRYVTNGGNFQTRKCTRFSSRVSMGLFYFSDWFSSLLLSIMLQFDVAAVVSMEYESLRHA